MRIVNLFTVKNRDLQKPLIYLFTLAICIFNTYGQELNLPVFTQHYADNDFVVSPTFAGIGDNLKIRANALTQWVGIKGAPDNQSTYADFRIADQSGIGFSFYNDRNGSTIQTGAKFSFAHHLVLDYYSKQYLSLGISYNINNFRLDVNSFTNNNPTEPGLNPLITDDRKTSNNNFDVGFLYRLDRYFLSFNLNNFLSKDLRQVVLKDEPTLLLNYQLYSGYTIEGPKRSGLEYEPSLFFQYFASDRRSSTDLNFKFRKFNRKGDYYWAGISYRFLNDQLLKPLNIGPMAGFQKSIFYFGYAYQVTTNDLASYNSGTHVITIGLEFLQGISNCPCTQSPVRY